MILASFLILAPALQEAPEPRETEIELVPLGGIEAPAQPQGRSSARVQRTPRFEPTPGRGAAGPIRSPVRSLVAVRGQEENHVMGVGLVTGLAGTGDSVQMTRQLVQNLLLTHNITIDLQELKPENCAIVRVESNLPPGIKPGRRIDVRVSTIGDAESLQGGTLTMTELTDITGSMVYATAYGPVNVGGFSAEGAGASATRNHVNVGTLHGKVEREVASCIVSDHGYIYLDLRAAHSPFGNMVRIAEAINQVYPEAAEATPDGRTVRVAVPEDLPESAWVAYLDSILKREVVPDTIPRVIINERTGVIVMGEGVRLRPGAIAHGNLTVTIAETPQASQPGPLSDGSTQVLDRTALNVEEENNGLAVVPGAVTLQEVVEVLNVLGTSPRDTISILEAMAQGGLLLADIQRM